MSSCVNCGTKLSDDICPNCQEEEYIFENQISADGMDIDLSDNFAETVKKQREQVKNKINK